MKTLKIQKKVQNLIALSAMLIAALAMAGCSDDDNPVKAVDESRDFTLTITNVSEAADYPVSGVFNTPVGKAMPGPALPGDAYEFEFGALPGDKLSFATMFVQSNDLFYAPDGGGIALFDGMTPVEGDVTAQVHLWDAGTEMNEVPGEGAHQAPRQMGANSGAADSDMAVRMVDDGFAYPDVADVIRVTLSYLGDGLFRARLEDVSDDMTLMIEGGSVAVPLAPGAFVVHTNDDPLFSSGTADMLGLEGLAEDGDPSALIASLEARTGLAVPLAPGLAVVHNDAAMLFHAGMSEGGSGLEALAEDGDPSGLAAWAGAMSGVSEVEVFNTPVGAGAAAPIFPGESYAVSFSAEPGDRLNFATMFVQSNDLFYAFDEGGVELFDAMGDPMSGDVTMYVRLWDAGTEMNQWPGVGPDQAPRQAGADTGAADSDTAVRMVDDGFAYPMNEAVVRVTLSVGS